VGIEHDVLTVPSAVDDPAAEYFTLPVLHVRDDPA